MELAAWLRTTQAAHVMVRNVVTLSADQSLAEAAAVFLHQQISGAPVVDQAGACVGVLSVSDLIGAGEKVAQERRKLQEAGFWDSPLALPASVYADRLAAVRDKIAPAAEQPVERFMTTDLVAVEERTSLARIVQQFVDVHIHRVLVVDAGGRLQGLISTTDILAAILRAARQDSPK